MIKEVQRVLKVGGYYMIISYGSPENRVIHLERKFEDFDVQIYSIKNNYIEDDEYDKVHYIYLCKKLKGADEASKFFFEETLKELERQEKLEKEMNNYCEKNI
jgi:ubiquinone/menaquinone biosynthesis C-methylase UbiE